jgi:DNA-directed RNA polymerase specialized sigma subunit
MTAKELLHSIKKMRLAIEAKEEKIAALQEMATNISPNLSGMPHNPRREQSSMANAVGKIVDLEREIEILKKQRQAAIDTIDLLPAGIYSKVLIKRYVREEIWEDIAAELQYSGSHIYQVHREAADSLQKFLENRSQS